MLREKRNPKSKPISKSFTKLIMIILLVLLSLQPLLADSESLKTEITTVSFGPHGMGFGFAPTGTDFMYYNNFNISKKLQYPAYFKTRLVFSGINNTPFGGFRYTTGTPLWSLKHNEINDWNHFIGGNYLNIAGNANIYVNQGFGVNPVEGAGPLINLGFEFSSFYETARESLDVSRCSASPIFIDAATGNYREPFQPGNKIQAYPWLQDTRNTLVNIIKADMSINLTRSTGFGASDGFYFNFFVEYAPEWLANNVTMKYPSADFYRLFISATQNLTLYNKRQANGMNWLTILVSHNSYLMRTAGNVVPRFRIPGDALENTFGDTLSLKFNGPQFIAGDCYTDFSLNLTNTCFFGHVVNENPKTTTAIQWQSNMNMYFHMRLFGFMHFEYTFGYNFMRGIHNWQPGFYQSAKIRFYIAL